MGLIPIPLCETHATKYSKFNGKPLNELPETLLSCQLKHLKYLKEVDMRLANAILRSNVKPSKLNAAGRVFSVMAGNYNAANWWALNTLNKNASGNAAYQMLANYAAQLDDKAKQVMEEINRRKPPPKEGLKSQDESDDAISVLRVRFAKGEITKDEYEEMLKLLKQQ
jgi:hypothetical protein